MSTIEQPSAREDMQRCTSSQEVHHLYRDNDGRTGSIVKLGVLIVGIVGFAKPILEKLPGGQRLVLADMRQL